MNTEVYWIEGNTYLNNYALLIFQWKDFLSLENVVFLSAFISTFEHMLNSMLTFYRNRY